MRLLVLISALLSVGVVGYAENSIGGSTKPSDKIIQVEVAAYSQIASLRLQGKLYDFGIFFDNRDFMEKIAVDPAAHTMFQTYLNRKTVTVVSGVTFVGLFLTGAGFVYYTTTQPKDSTNITSGVVGVALLGGALVSEIVYLIYEPDTEKRYFDAINKYNTDVLDGNNQ